MSAKDKQAVSDKWQAPRKSYADDMRENLSTDGTVRGGSGKRSGEQTRKGKEQPSVAGQASATSGSASPRTDDGTDVPAESKQSGSENNPTPIKRNKIGTGSYEDPSGEKRRKRRSTKTGRPGR